LASTPDVSSNRKTQPAGNHVGSAICTVIK
jgi:hypothetical protein